MTTEQRNPEEKIDTGKQTSRRGLLRKAVIGAPIALTLAHRPAFGAVCSISGFQSVNPSGVAQQPGPGCGGYSPGSWKNPDNNGDGSRADWLTAGYRANPRSGQNPVDPDATTFFSIFSRTPPNGDATTSLHDVMKSNSAVAKHATANLLNAGFFPGYRLITADVIGLYQAYVDLKPSYMTAANGTVVNMNNIDLEAFFKQYH